MPIYSSERFCHDWRFDLKQDFVDAEGNPFQYAKNGKQSWGDELHKLDFGAKPNKATVSHDGKRLAVAVDHDVLIVETKDFNTGNRKVLKGHTSKVDAIAFQPSNSDVLVSCAMNHTAGSTPTKPTIILWDLSKTFDHPELSPEDTESACDAAADRIVSQLASIDPFYTLDDDEKRFLSKSIRPNLDQSIARHLAASNFQLSGRLTSNFQSENFSYSGDRLIYLPGKRPRSNDVDTWDIKVFSMKDRKDILTLSGHTDAIMWVGFSPDDKFIGTVAWDKTIRIWDATNGDSKYVFETTGQNWTGAFSPDTKYFAGTTGNGTVHVYLLADGTEIATESFGRDWCRAISWSPAANEPLLAIGGRSGGNVVILDVGAKKIVQERILSAEKSLGDPSFHRMLLHYLEIQAIKFVDGGQKLVFFTSGDGSAEVYDLKHDSKWRFARLGTDPDFIGETTTKSGYDLVVWEDKEKGQVMLASVDDDAIRIWSVPMNAKQKGEGE